VPYGLAISMFGRYNEDGFVFRENKIILETGASVYIHVMSANRIESIFTLDKFCLTSHYCVKKSCHHRLCGKVFLINSTARRHLVRYILNKSFDGRRLSVLHHMRGSLITFSCFEWNKDESKYVFDHRDHQNYTINDIVPISI